MCIRDRAEEGLALIDGMSDANLEVRHVRALASEGGSVSVAGIEAELGSLLDRVKADDDARSRFLELLEVLDPDSPATGAVSYTHLDVYKRQPPDRPD